MADRHAEALTRLEQRLRTAPGQLSPQARAAAIDADPLPDPLAQGYVETVRDQIFELTVGAAFGAAKRRLDAGLRALGETAGDRPRAGEG